MDLFGVLGSLAIPCIVCFIIGLVLLVVVPLSSPQSCSLRFAIQLPLFIKGSLAAIRGLRQKKVTYSYHQVQSLVTPYTAPLDDVLGKRW